MPGIVLSTTLDRERRDIDVSNRIALLEPDATPLTVVTMRARKEATKSAELIWFDDSMGARWTAINNGAGYAAGDTALVVDDETVFEVNDVIKVTRTGELLRVTAITTATKTITVTRAFGTTAAAALVDNDWLLNIGSANKEASTTPNLRSGQPVKKTNYAQIFRNAFGVSGTQDAEKLKAGEPERERLSRKYGVQHRVDIEAALLFGEPKETVGTEVIRSMGGVFYYVTSNVYDVGGLLTDKVLETNIAEMAFAKGSKRKLALCSALGLSAINRFAAGRLRTVPRQDVFGLSLQEYVTAHGTLLLGKSDLLVNGYGGHMVILDVVETDNIKLRPLRDTILKKNVQAPGYDGYTDEYFSEMSAEIRLEKTHTIVKGITG